jgi:hypothetical protein
VGQDVTTQPGEGPNHVIDRFRTRQEMRLGDRVLQTGEPGAQPPVLLLDEPSLDRDGGTLDGHGPPPIGPILPMRGKGR